MFAPEPPAVQIVDVADLGALRSNVAVRKGPPAPQMWSACYARGSALFLGIRASLLVPAGRLAGGEFLVVRVRPWWSRGGLKVVASFGLPPRRRS